MYFDQREYSVRCEWGLMGVTSLAPLSDVVVIVDVLSFTTSVDIVTARGGVVFPYRGAAEGLADFARSVDAAAAGHRAGQGDVPYSLAPSTLVNIPRGLRLVLPSPNGSTLSLATGDVPTLAGCLRNARAVADRAARLGQHITVIAAGERWPDGSLRPALEDWLGAGAIIAQLPGQPSPEAELAAAAFRHAETSLPETLLRCGSGKELVGRGFGEDVRIAGQLNISQAAPLLTEGAYQAA